MPNLLKEKPKKNDTGKILGGILLVSGTAIGASMLALPLSTAPGGFLPTIIGFVIACFFVTFGTLYILEVNLWFTGKDQDSAGQKDTSSQDSLKDSSKQDSAGIDIIGMASHTLGPIGKYLAAICYLMLLYALISAYFTGASAWFIKLLTETTHFDISRTWAIAFLAILFGYVISLGAGFTEKVNGILAFVLFAALSALFLSTIQSVDPLKLEVVNPGKTLPILPLMITAFGYSVVVPSLTDYMKGDAKALRYIIIMGGLLTLFIYILWEIITLGNISYQGQSGLLALGKSHDDGTGVVRALENLTGLPWITEIGAVLAICAILTSLLGVSLALNHFLGDATRLAPRGINRLILFILTYGPPLALVFVYPAGFSRVLSFAGIFVAFLFGILPIVMVWVGRNDPRISKPGHNGYKVMGGKGMMIGVALFFAYVIYLEIKNCNCLF